EGLADRAREQESRSRDDERAQPDQAERGPHGSARGLIVVPSPRGADRAGHRQAQSHSGQGAEPRLRGRGLGEHAESGRLKVGRKPLVPDDAEEGVRDGGARSRREAKRSILPELEPRGGHGARVSDRGAWVSIAPSRRIRPKSAGQAGAGPRALIAEGGLADDGAMPDLTT